MPEALLIRGDICLLLDLLLVSPFFAIVVLPHYLLIKPVPLFVHLKTVSFRLTAFGSQVIEDEGPHIFTLHRRKWFLANKVLSQGP